MLHQALWTLGKVVVYLLILMVLEMAILPRITRTLAAAGYSVEWLFQWEKTAGIHKVCLGDS